MACTVGPRLHAACRRKQAQRHTELHALRLLGAGLQAVSIVSETSRSCGSKRLTPTRGTRYCGRSAVVIKG